MGATEAHWKDMTGPEGGMPLTKAVHVWATVQKAKQREMARNERTWDLEEEIWIPYMGQDRAHEHDIDTLKPSASCIIDNLCKGLRDTGIGSKTKDWSYKPFDGPGPTNHSDFSTTQYIELFIGRGCYSDIRMELHGALGFDAFKDLKGESSGSVLNTILTYRQSLASWMHLAYGVKPRAPCRQQWLTSSTSLKLRSSFRSLTPRRKRGQINQWTRAMSWPSPKRSILMS
jgi:hypothetical protein